MKLSAQEAQDFLRSRRSVRRFMQKAVPGEVLECILETSTRAPSAHNRQPWRFAILSTLDAKQRLADAMGFDFRQDLLQDGLSVEEAEATVQRSRRRILEAPVAVVMCLDVSEMDVYPDEKRRHGERIMAVQSVAMAGATLLLSAHALGLGGVWICAPLFAPQAATRALELPPAWEAQGLILLGYPEKLPEPRPRKPLSEVALFY